MITLSEEFLTYQTKLSTRNSCKHCNKFSCKHDLANIEHQCVLDPNINTWVEVCLCCGMVSKAD